MTNITKVLGVGMELSGPVLVHGVNVSKRSFALDPMALVAVDLNRCLQHSIGRLEITACLLHVLVAAVCVGVVVVVVDRMLT